MALDMPRISVSGSGLEIVFESEGSDQIQVVEMVLDFDEEGQVFGLEILGLTYQTSKSALKLISACGESADFRQVYDAENDALYAALPSMSQYGRSISQLAVDGELSLRTDGAIVKIAVDWSAYTTN